MKKGRALRVIDSSALKACDILHEICRGMELEIV